MARQKRTEKNELGICQRRGSEKVRTHMRIPKAIRDQAMELVDQGLHRDFTDLATAAIYHYLRSETVRIKLAHQG